MWEFAAEYSFPNNGPLCVLIIILQALNAVDKGLAIQSNAQLLKLKGDILKDLKHMSEAEKVI